MKPLRAMAMTLAWLFLLGTSMPSIAQDISNPDKDKDKPATSPRDFTPPNRLGPRKAITDAPMLAVDKVNDEVQDNELVLGVVVEGEARAYPINMLTGPSREIINDTLGKHAIAATW